MKKIRVSADLERKIRAWNEDPLDDGSGFSAELIAALDAEEPKKAPGVSYSKIVECLREGLGSRLATPQKPHVSWIIKQVNRVKELGLDEQQLRELGHRTAQTYNNARPVELEFILRAAVRLLAPVASGGIRSGAGSPGKVYTGRPGDDE